MIVARQGGLEMGRYHSCERLGGSALGETFRARLCGLAGFEKELAVKLLRDDLARDADFMQRFMQAASVQAALQSDRIVCVHDVEIIDGHYLLASELARGVDLAQLLARLRKRRERLSDDCALWVALGVAEVLAFAHKRTDLKPCGVLHLGLTPRQVMITPEGEVRLLDVGLRVPLLKRGWTRDERLAQMAAYAAPEVRELRDLDARADVFSVGALLREMTGPSPGGRITGILRCSQRDQRDARCPTMERLRSAILPLIGGRLLRIRRELAQVVARVAPAESFGVPELATADEPLSVALGAASGQVPAFAEEHDIEQLEIEFDVDVDLARTGPRAPSSRLRTYAPLAAALLLVAAAGAVTFRRARSRGTPLHRLPAITAARSAIARAAPARVRLEVRSEPRGARVYVDGELRGMSPLDLELPEGLHPIALVAAGWQLWHQRLLVRGEDRRLEVVLAGSQHLPGSAGLKVHCVTRDELRIFLDGADTGMDCPNLQRIPIATGRHHLALFSPRGDALVQVQKEVRIPQGERSTRIYLRY